jgi:catechol 2,3-dioxygenase-like lactoylglutathione lyase family enzyme
MPAKENAQRPKLTHLSHMAFYAHDMERSIGFYRNVMGYTRIDRDGGDGATVAINNLQHITLLREKEQATDRLHSFGFVTEDAEALRGYLRSRGLTVPTHTEQLKDGSLCFAVTDPDGHVVEFVEHRPTRSPDFAGAGAGGDDRISGRLMHIGFIVRSLDAAMAFYRDILGCVEIWRGTRDGRQLSWVQLTLPNSIDYIELMLYDAPLSLERLGMLNHYGLEVPDIRNAKELLGGRVGYFGYTRPLDAVIGACHHRLMNTFDPDGSRAELMERATFNGAPKPSSEVAPPR